jgi:hypothetical protein
MLRPIQITPITDQTPIRSTLVPSTMSQEEYLANQFRSGNFAQPAAMAASRPMQQPAPVSPVQGLVQTGQEGLQGAERISKQVAKSPRVQGLLGGGETAQGLLGDIQGNAALQGLFGTLQAMGRPVRRGEDRLIGAVQYGQQVMGQAQQRGMQDLSNRMQLEKYQREKQLQDARLRAMQADTSGIDVTSTFTEYERSQMSPAQIELAKRSVAAFNRGSQMMAIDADAANEFFDQSKDLYSQALRGVRTQTEAFDKEAGFQKEFKKDYVDVANQVSMRGSQLRSMIDEGGPVTNFLAFVSAFKMAEPTSAVLASEVDSAQEMASIMTRIESIAAQLDPNDPLPPALRDNLLVLADLMEKSGYDFYQYGVGQMKPIYERFNLNPDNIIIKPYIANKIERDPNIGKEAKQDQQKKQATIDAATTLIGEEFGGSGISEGGLE